MPQPATRCCRLAGAAAALLAGMAVASAAAQAPAGEGEGAARAADVEELVVTAPRLEPGEVPSPTIMVQTYGALKRGGLLYGEGKYEEALPLLLLGAKRGFKWAQARLGDIYLHGRGGVPRDVEAGLGWLGVAAKSSHEPSILRYFRQAMAEVPAQHAERMAAIVADYRERWNARNFRVTCERVPGESAAGTSSLRLRRLQCRFMDEVPVCRTPYVAPAESLFGGPPTDDIGGRWVCPDP